MTNQTSDLSPLSLPFFAPPYEPIWFCKGFKRVSLVCDIGSDAMSVLLANTPFEPTGSRCEIFTDDLSGHSLGGFNESGVAVPVSYDGVQGIFHSVVFVTTDVAMIAGREVFGYPKLIADVSFEQTGSRIVCTTTRGGAELLHLECELGRDLAGVEELAPLSDRASGGEWEWTHHLLVKSIPSPHEGKADFLSVIYRNIGGRVLRASAGDATLRLGTAKEVAPVGDVKVVAAHYLEGDFGGDRGTDRRTLYAASDVDTTDQQRNNLAP